MEVEKVGQELEVTKSYRTPTAQELKKHFIDIAWPIVDSYVNAALGKEELASFNTGCREEVWELVKKLMVQSSDKMSLDIQNPRDVVLAVERGDCTFKEAEQLLDLYQRVKEIESNEVPVGSAGLPGVNIMIATSSGEEKPLAIEGKVIDCEHKS